MNNLEKAILDGYDAASRFRPIRMPLRFALMSFDAGDERCQLIYQENGQGERLGQWRSFPLHSRKLGTKGICSDGPVS